MTKAKLRELWASIAAAIGDSDEDTEDGTLTIETITATARSVAPTVYQKVFDAGHSERNKKAVRELADVQGKLDAANTELERVRAGKPASTDDEKARRITELEAQVQTLTADKTRLEQEHKTALAESARALKVESLRTKLVARDGERMDPDYAEVLLAKAENAGRVRVNDDGTVDVLGPSGVPFAPGDGKDALDMFADELIATTKRDKPKFVLVAGDAGSGTGGNSGRNNGGGERSTGDKALFDGIRTEVKERQETTKPEGGTGAERMGLRIVGAGTS